MIAIVVLFALFLIFNNAVFTLPTALVFFGLAIYYIFRSVRVLKTSQLEQSPVAFTKAVILMMYALWILSYTFNLHDVIKVIFSILIWMEFGILLYRQQSKKEKCKTIIFFATTFLFAILAIPRG